MQEQFRETGKALKELWELQWITGEEGMTKWWNTLFQWDKSSQPLPLSAECFLTSTYLLLHLLHSPPSPPSFSLSYSVSLFFLCSHPIFWMATHSSILAWTIPRTEETCGLQWGLQESGSQESDTTEWLSLHFTISWTESETQPVRCVECRKQEMKRFLMHLWATVSQWTWQTI